MASKCGYLDQTLSISSSQIIIKNKPYLKTKFLPGFLGVVNVIDGTGVIPNIEEWQNILYNEKSDDVQIECMKGRARRPLIIVKEGKPLLTEKHMKQIEKNETGMTNSDGEACTFLFPFDTRPQTL